MKNITKFHQTFQIFHRIFRSKFSNKTTIKPSGYEDSSVQSIEDLDLLHLSQDIGNSSPDNYLKQDLTRKELQSNKKINSNLNPSPVQHSIIPITDPLSALNSLIDELNCLNHEIIALKKFIKNLQNFFENALFYTNKTELTSIFEEFSKKFAKHVFDNCLDDNYSTQALINFLNKIVSIEFKELNFISQFYYDLFYEAVTRVSNEDSKDLSMLFYKDFEYKELTLNNNIQSNGDKESFDQNSEDDIIIKRSKENLQAMKKLTNVQANFVKSLLETFTTIFNDNFYHFKNKTSFLVDIMFIYELHLKAYVKDSDSNMMFIATIDDYIDNYLIHNMKDMKMINFILTNFVKLKLLYKKNGRLFINIMLTLCKCFNYQKDLLNKQLYVFNHLLFLRHYYKEGFTHKHVSSSIFSNAFYFNDILTREDLKPFHTQLLLHTLYLYAHLNFEVSQNLVNEISLRTEAILKNLNPIQITILVAGLGLSGKSNYNLFKSIMEDERLYKLSKKHFYNIGFYIAMTKFDNIELWRKWFKAAASYKNINNYDIRMIKEIMHFLNLIGGEYKEFETYNNLFKFAKEGDADFKRWWQSKSVGGYGLSEMFIIKGFDNMGIEYKKQGLIKELYSVDFIIGDKIIVNVNGPQHYWSTNRLKLDRRSDLKTQVLRNLGYYVVNIHLMSLISFEGYSKTSNIIMDMVKNVVPPEVYAGIKKKKINSN